jgi:CheY-like chemotaxis protein
MPGLHGLELARRLRALPGLGRVLLVCVSGYGEEATADAAREAGCDLHLLKPADPDQLRKLLEEAARRGAGAA